MKKLIGLMTLLTLIAGLGACSSNAASDQQASPSNVPTTASTTQPDGAMKGDAMHNGNAMKGDAMKGDAMHNGNAMKGDAMKKDTTTKP